MNMKKIATMLNWVKVWALSVLLIAVSACSTNDDSGMPTVSEETENTPEVEEPEESEEEESGEEEQSEGTEESEGMEESEETEAPGEVEASPTIFGLIETTEGLPLFKQALAKTDLPNTLNGEAPHTVFAPTDAAVEELFAVLGDDYHSFDDFKNPIEQKILNEILLGHVVEGNLPSQDFMAGTVPTLLPDDSIELVAQAETYVIRDASEILTNFVAFDLEASNGTVHMVDKILIPQKVLTFVE
jgi:uncharacterized surface protein with fasciclin (FAS1) repeats